MRTVYGFAIVMAKLCTASHVSFINKHLETVSAREREDTMYTIRTMSPQYQAWVSSVGTLVRTPPPTRHLGWRQRHHLWCAACRCERLQRLDALWDAHHEQVRGRTAGSSQEGVIQQSRPALRLAIYHHLALF
jgi:hypothetical protein